MNERGEHIRFTPSSETLKRLKDVIDNARTILGTTRFDCVDGRAARDFDGEAFGDFQNIGYSRGAMMADEIIKDYLNSPPDMSDLWLFETDETLGTGSLAWKFPDALEVRGWETPADPTQSEARP